MKIKKSTLNKLIKEEIENVLQERYPGYASDLDGDGEISDWEEEWAENYLPGGRHEEEGWLAQCLRNPDIDPEDCKKSPSSEKLWREPSASQVTVSLRAAALLGGSEIQNNDFLKFNKIPREIRQKRPLPSKIRR